MKETGIIMSGNHPLKILDGTKTMTRRVIKPQPFKGAWDATAEHPSYGWFWKKLYQTWDGEDDFFRRLVEHCPYGQAGDRLWVREKFAIRNDGQQVMHYAGYQEIIKALALPDFNIKWKPSIFMPRWASRITLEITEVRAERLQEVSKMDARAEGSHFAPNYLDSFRKLWDSLNAKRGYGWEINPWVWAINFKLVNQADSEVAKWLDHRTILQ